MKKWIQRSFRNRMFTAMLLAALLPLLLGGALMLRLQVVRIESGLARQADLRLRELEAALTEVYAPGGHETACVLIFTTGKAAAFTPAAVPFRRRPWTPVGGFCLRPGLPPA